MNSGAINSNWERSAAMMADILCGRMSVETRILPEKCEQLASIEFQVCIFPSTVIFFYYLDARASQFASHMDFNTL